MRLPAQDSFCRGAPPAPHLLLPLVGRHPCVPPPTYAVPSTAGHIGPALQAFRRGRCPHRPARTVPPKNCHCEPVRTLVWQSVIPLHRTPNPRVRAGFYPARLSRTSNHAPVGGGACPPSCQPIPVHCRGRQSGHFLETGSLLPPPAALCRFPRRPVSPHPLIRPCRAAPMCRRRHAPHPQPCSRRGRRPRRPARHCTAPMSRTRRAG